MSIRCHICKTAQVESVDQAVDQGWTPTFWVNQYQCGPACPGCTATHLSQGEDGEMEMSCRVIDMDKIHLN